MNKIRQFFYILFKNRSAIVLVLIYISLLVQTYWFFGVLLLLWLVQDFFRKETYIMNVIRRDDSPILYWLTLITWLILGLIQLPWVQSLVWKG